VLNSALRTQSLARALDEHELALAAALEAIFAEGVHEPSAIAEALQARGVKHLGGSTGAWTATTLIAALQALNTTLDAAYAEHGIGA
jgi:hypothetical protein